MAKITRKMIEEAIKSYNPKLFSKFELASELKTKTLNNAAKHIVKTNNKNEIIAVMSTASLFSGKEGFVLTENYLYFSKSFSQFSTNNISKINLNDLKSVIPESENSTYKNDLFFKYENGEEVRVFCNIYSADLLNLLTILLKSKNNADNERQEVKKEPVKLAAAATKSTDSTVKAAPVTVNKPITAPTNTAKQPAPTTSNTIKQPVPAPAATVKQPVPSNVNTVKPSAPIKANKEVKKEAVPIKASSSVNNAKVLAVTNSLKVNDVFKFMGSTYICTEAGTYHEDFQINSKLYYNYNVFDLETHTNKKILVSETVIKKHIDKKDRKEGPNYRYAQHGETRDKLTETEILKTTCEIFSDTQEAGFGKASRVSYGAYSKRVDNIEFTIIESKLCTCTCINSSLIKDIINGDSYPINDSRAVREGNIYTAVIISGKAYLIYALPFETSRLSLFLNGKFSIYDDLGAFKNGILYLPISDYKTFIYKNGNYTPGEPQNGEFYEIRYTENFNRLPNILLITPIKMEVAYGVIQASATASYGRTVKKELKFTSYNNYGSYIVFPNSISDELFETIKDKIVFAKIFATTPDSKVDRYAIVNKLYCGNEIEMVCTGASPTCYTFKQKNGQLNITIPNRVIKLNIREGYEVRALACSYPEFSDVNKEATLCYITEIKKETEQKAELPSTDKLSRIKFSDLKKGDIYYNDYKESFIAIYNLSSIDADMLDDVAIDGIDLNERIENFQFISLEEYVNIVERKSISIEKIPCVIKDNYLVITTKNGGQYYLNDYMTYKIFDSKVPPKHVYVYRYGNIYYFATSVRDKTCL